MPADGRRRAPSRRPSKSRRTAPPRQVELVVESLGGGGDGVARVDGRVVFVPYTLPGDTVVAEIGDAPQAKVLRRVADGPRRIAPACRHFEDCGGCAVQHVAASEYRAWKRGLLADALAKRGLEAEIADLVLAPPGARRRVRLGYVAAAGFCVLGFNARLTNRIVDIAECPVADPAILAILPALRSVLARVLPPKSRGDVLLTVTRGGLDILIDGAAELDLTAREAFAAFAQENDIARLSWRNADNPPEPLARLHPPEIDFGGVALDLPPSGFLQATEAGEAALRDVAMAALAGCARVADLFAGCGAFALPLAASGKTVHAYEVDRAAVAALARAAGRAGIGGNLVAETRDLDRRPLMGAELARLDGLVLDPPRAGAGAQIAALAETPVPVVVYASCNPATFARDARVLVDAGYRLGRIVPVDQFLWSPHLELAAVFTR